MKRAALSLAVLTVLGLASGTALAAHPYGTRSAVTIAAHRGQSGGHCGVGRGYGSYGRVSHGRPMYGYPAYGYGYSRHPVVVHPRVYPTYRYYNVPRSGISYYGRGFGISVGF